MHDDGTDADVLHERDVLHDLVFEDIADHRIAAVFYDNRLPVEFLYVRERFYENGRLVRCLIQMTASLSSDADQV